MCKPRAGCRLLLAEDDPRLRQIVGRKLDLHLVARHDADEMLPHFARDVGENDVVVCELHPEHGAGQNGSNLPFEFDRFFGIHICCKTGAPCESAGSQNQ